MPFFVKTDPSTSGTGVVQGDHAGEPSAVHSEEQDDKLKIHYPDIALLQKTSAKPIPPDIIWHGRMEWKWMKLFKSSSCKDFSHVVNLLIGKYVFRF